MKCTATIFALLITACQQAPEKKNVVDTAAEKINVANTLDSFNVAAGNADIDAYFNFFTDDAIFIGTDATERWTKAEFRVWAKPYFDAKTTWNFKSISRFINLDSTGQIAWFDELLNTHMKICRGSGVLVKRGNEWKVQEYVLSMTMPNAKIDSAVLLKTKQEDSVINSLRK